MRNINNGCDEDYIEDYSDEIIQSLVEDYSDDKKLLGSMMVYLLSEVKDDNFAIAIIDVLLDLGICPTCGTPLVEYTYKEVHPELDCNDTEENVAMLCPNCDLAH